MLLELLALLALLVLLVLLLLLPLFVALQRLPHHLPCVRTATGRHYDTACGAILPEAEATTRSKLPSTRRPPNSRRAEVTELLVIQVAVALLHPNAINMP